MTSPVFTIVVPTYNRAHLIAKTMATILAQDFTDFEIIVVDDGSKDDTEAVIKSFSDHRIKYVKKDNGERGAARNFGAALGAGAYVNFVDSDDLLYPNHLSEAKKMIELYSQPEFFHLAYDHKLEDGTLLNKVQDFKDDIRDIILFNNKLSCNGVFLRKDIITNYPFQENRIMASSEDWELWIRLICRFKLHYSNTITSSVINHDFRSLRTIPAEKVVARDLLMIEDLRSDPQVMKTYGRSFKKFIAERYTFFMLSFAEQKKRYLVFQWAFQAVRAYPLILFTKRFLASIKNSIK
jgi:glycosyltransferase involved in cell wall biosynthesis